MDPNVNLREQLEITKRIMDGRSESEGDVERLAELIEALDAWLKAGGYLPERWQR